MLFTSPQNLNIRRKMEAQAAELIPMAEVHVHTECFSNGLPLYSAGMRYVANKKRHYT